MGCEHTPYDVLLDEYEVGMTVGDYDPLFSGLKARLVPLLAKIMESGTEIPRLPEDMVFPADAKKSSATKLVEQWALILKPVEWIGRHTHSVQDFALNTRFTTRFDEKDPFSCLYAVMHESGHGVYEQGLPREHSFSPVGGAVSLGVHESQSSLGKSNR